MTDKAKLVEIIKYLKRKPIANKQDIAKEIGESWSNGKFKAMLETLIDYKLIREIKTDTYKITPEGEKFESFEKLEEDKNWEVRLAKSNIEANEFQKTMARKNHTWMIVNIIATTILCLATVLQVLSSIIQTE